MGLRVCEVYKKKLNEATGVKRTVVEYLDISFIQKIDEKTTMTKKLLDKVDYLNANSVKGKIEVQNFANEVFIEGTIKVPPECRKIIAEIINCLDALESLKNGKE